MSSDRPLPAISCKGVWQVYGANAGHELKRALADANGNSIEASRLLKERGLVPAVQDVSFDVHEGEVFVIMGLSGSGKSTLIRTISRLVQGTAGTIEINGEDILTADKRRLIELRRTKLGMVFQHFGLFPHMSVLDNVGFPLKMQGVDRAARRERALDVLKLVGLSGRESAYPRELSGGQRQRVGIARALAVNPDLWFLDEPYSALDPLIRRQLQDEFLKLQEGLQKTSVFITHDITEALKLADRIAIMRDGRIVQIGTPDEIIVNPVDDYVREFTRDVPKGRYSHVSSMMGMPDTLPAMPDDPKIEADMTIDDALASCMSLYQPVPVWGADGKMAGIVHPGQLASALQAERS
ncbi:glycine betaine/L-proline transport ATP binding subunit [Rhizobium leguminosarum bv. trifolii WSM597]|uniref:Quaternary amine transport ATP-binding protein n=1 Tax=Rhizobium leguminosarum bv. trifolii WSM597 TaxID=754764 RepID=I9NBL9_RHILT|nr:glycine betaine/L-proline ABC transporter ATP-binding protein [Rhizobium leguminosarum]EJB04137.1 glycine betaine/L-proline transport ATP binding subunit [Rhizobium leguminosarum bv. trifolii WSM597]